MATDLGGARHRRATEKQLHRRSLLVHGSRERKESFQQQVGKPILSLRLLGKLTDEFSCANSRFFRTVLYPNAEVSYCACTIALCCTGKQCDQCRQSRSTSATAVNSNGHLPATVFITSSTPRRARSTRCPACTAQKHFVRGLLECRETLQITRRQKRYGKKLLRQQIYYSDQHSQDLCGMAERH